MASIILPENASAPATPAAGYSVLYPKTDGLWYFKDDAGTEHVFVGSPVAVADGGSGRTSATAYAVICGGTTTTAAHQSVASVGTSGQLLTSNGAGALPTFQDAATQGPTLGTYTALSGSTSVLIGSSLPSTIKKIQVIFTGLSGSSATAHIMGVQIGDSGGIESTGYSGSLTSNNGSVVGGAAFAGDMFPVSASTSNAADALTGILTLINVSGNIWVGFGGSGRTDALSTQVFCGVKTLTGTLTQIQMTITGASVTYDAGNAVILYQ